ncbi:MAG: class I SAM-dependent methyltransferase [Candidatus Scalindua sp.]|nr:class I SAM-dependent methyltransferase [Candidatus Scalindua sp.]
MDLRKYKLTKEQLEKARELACRGLICYQPFIFSDDLITGAGYEFARIAEGAGLVYSKEIPKTITIDDSVRRHLIDPSILADFKLHNEQLRVLYESMIDLVYDKVPSPEDLTFADIGSCTGYFPLSLSKRGVKEAVGFDSVDYAETYNLMNDILGTNADFRCSPYRGDLGAIENAGVFDVAISIAVLVHLSDPLQHLAFIGRIARKALFVWTWTSEDEEDEMVIHFKSVNRYYEHTKFPFCFDVMQISPGLLKRSLELMGFTEIYELENKPNGMPDYWFKRHRGYLGIRPEGVTAENFVPERYTAPLSFALGKAPPHLVETIGRYNLISYSGRYYGIPHALGQLEIDKIKPEEMEGVLMDISLTALRKKLKSLA